MGEAVLYCAGCNVLTVTQATKLVIEAAKALNAARAKDIVHRDTKPANVVLRSGRWITVLDFGSVRHVSADSRLRVNDATMGTPHRMSPEQGDAHELHGPSDNARPRRRPTVHSHTPKLIEGLIHAGATDPHRPRQGPED